MHSLLQQSLAWHDVQQIAGSSHRNGCKAAVTCSLDLPSDPWCFTILLSWTDFVPPADYATSIPLGGKADF